MILDLLRKDEFPRIHRPSFESQEVLRLLRHRHKLVQLRTRAKNSLQALAYGAGSAKRAQLLSRKERERLAQLPMSAAMGLQQRGEWLSLAGEFNRSIKGVDEWLEQQAQQDGRVGRLRTHPGLDVFFVSISRDPETDAPERVRRWGADYSAGPGRTLVTCEQGLMSKLVRDFTGEGLGREMHSASLLNCNDRTGVWTETEGLFSPEALINVIDMVALCARQIR